MTPFLRRLIARAESGGTDGKNGENEKCMLVSKMGDSL
jgi:hypothetical protein